MQIKQKLKQLKGPPNHKYQEQPSRNYLLLSPTTNVKPFPHQMKSKSPSIQKSGRGGKIPNRRERIVEKGEDTHEVEPFLDKNMESQFEVLKNKIKNVLRRMKYKDKLNHLEILVKEARFLAQKYGYFYVTGANFVFKPESEIKLSIWVHPNLQQQKCMHPIRLHKLAQKEKEFYRSLKMALKEIFPTISLGDDNSYKAIIQHIHQLQQALTKRLIKSVSTNFISVLNSPRNNQQVEKTASNKILKVSRLIDFQDGISIIEEGDQELSVSEQKKFWKKTNQLSPNLNLKKLKTLEEKRIPTSRSIVKHEPSLEISHIMKEDEGQFTLEDSKVQQTSRDRISSRLLAELRQILNA